MTPFRVVVCGGLLLVLGAAVVPPAPLPAQDANKTITNSIGMKLVLIPAGKFQMGSPAGEAERDSEELQHEVSITRPFYLGAHEVTQGQLQKVMGSDRSFFSAKNGGGPDFPAEQVSWKNAVLFCQRLSALDAEKKAGRSYRLPSEAEWEYACRAGTQTTFHGGNSLSAKQANFNGNHPYGGAARGVYRGRTAKVGSYPANAWGLYDMHGNVAEWCGDYYDPNYYKNSPKSDPQGPAAGVQSTGYHNEYFRVARGGCWLDEARACRAAYRSRFQPTEPYRLVGLRVVCLTKAP